MNSCKILQLAILCRTPTDGSEADPVIRTPFLVVAPGDYDAGTLHDYDRGCDAVCKTVYANLHTVRNVPLIVHARRSRDALVPLLYFRYFRDDPLECSGCRET